jgi:hypothetical protein
MRTTTDELAAAWLDGMLRLGDLTPKGWQAGWGEARAFVTQAAVPSLNAVVSLAVDPDVTALDELATVVGRFGVPWSIIVRGRPGEDVAKLADGYALISRSAMTFMMCTVDSAVLPAAAERREHIHVVGSADSGVYTEILTEAFEAPAGIFGSLMEGQVLDSSSTTGYLAELSGRPVATGLGCLGERAVGVFNIGVVPWARGHGLGRAMTARVMSDGFAAGADTAYLHSSAAGRKLYESMGFQHVETWTMFSGS